MNNYIRITTMCFILLVSAALFGVAETVQAETYSGKCGEDVYWNYDSEEEVFRVSGNGAMTSAPWMHGSEDYDAKYGDITFYDTKVVIEKGVTAVVDEAFYFRGIKEVVFGPDVVEIGERAFSTTNLSNISFSDSIRKVGKCAFDVTRIRSIDLKNVEEVGERAFEGCGNLEKVVFGENLKTIFKGAFADCLNLKEIEFRGGAPKIAKSAFKDDRFMKTIVNHSNVSIPIQNLDKDLFWYQDGKKVTSVSPGKTAKSKGRLFRVKYKDLQGKFQGKLPKSYRYAEDKALPTKGKRKGYFFYGWSVDELWLNDLCDIRGDLTLRPIWVRYHLTKINGNKRKFSYEISKKYEYFYCRTAQIRYADNKKMKKSKLIWEENLWRGNVTLKGLKKGKKYYVQFRTKDESSVSPWSNPIVIQN